MSFQNIRTEKHGQIGHLVFARSERQNAVHHAMLAEVCVALDVLIADEEVRAIILRADGSNFCAGADFEYLERLPETPALDIEGDIYAHFQGAARRLYHCPKPTIAAIHGAAVTVGCELALACDFRVVSPMASFRESWILLGLMPPLGGLFLLPRIIGMARAAQMVLRAEVVDAERAVAWGLALEMADPENLLDRAASLAEELAALPRSAYAAVKQGLHRGLETSMEAEWTSNVSKQALLIGSEDFKAALAAMKSRIASRSRRSIQG